MSFSVVSEVVHSASDDNMSMTQAALSLANRATDIASGDDTSTETCEMQHEQFGTLNDKTNRKFCQQRW